MILWELGRNGEKYLDFRDILKVKFIRFVDWMWGLRKRKELRIILKL